jgi:SAM-dependent methyltransferase
MAGWEVRLYDLGAWAYSRCTAQDGWRASCRALAAHLPADVARVLDLGCGPGGVAAAVAATHPAAAVYGLDLAAGMLAEARRDPAGQRLVRADAALLPFADEAFDAVTSHSFLYLVAARGAVLAEVRRVLRPGGRLLLVEPWAGPVRVGAVLRHGRDPRFLLSVSLWRAFNRFRGRFGARELAALLRQQGFVTPRGAVVLGGLALLARADKPGATTGR